MSPMSYQGRYWILVPASDSRVGKKLKVHGVALTQSGRELFTIVAAEPMEGYSGKLFKFLEQKGYSMVEIKGDEPRIVSINAGMVCESQ